MDVCWKDDPCYRTVDSRKVRCHLYPEGGDPECAEPAGAGRLKE
jgi:hypothetical protein